MPKPNLRAVESDRLHPRDRARQAVKRFRLDREKDHLPVSNQYCTGAKPLNVDEVLERAAPKHLGKK